MTNPDPNIAFQATVNTTKDEDGDNVYEGLLNAINCPASEIHIPLGMILSATLKSIERLLVHNGHSRRDIARQLATTFSAATLVAEVRSREDLDPETVDALQLQKDLSKLDMADLEDLATLEKELFSDDPH